jgi:WhiB family redox-sensing transcriptional regulator
VTTQQFPCQSDPEIFYEAENERGKPKEQRIAAAKALCAQCPLPARQACLEVAMKAEGGLTTGRYGIFGGYTPEERMELAKARGYEPPRAYHPGHGTAARARVHRRAGEKPCKACLQAESGTWQDRARKGSAA